jgi:HemY protein
MMLWSLIKILAFVLGVTALTYGAMELSQIQGEVLITFAGLEMRLGPLELAFGLVGMVVLTWIMFKLLGMLVAFLKFLNGDETAVSRYFTRNRVERGYQALTEGMMAVASGEGHLALAKAAKAEKLLDKPELTTLLIAQAAEVAGDQKKAEAAYKLLLTEDRTRFVGIRGLMQQKLAAGDTNTALKLAQKAFELKPKHEATQDTLLKLQADSGDWTGARATLAAKAKSGGLPKDVLRRRDAVLALSEAKDLISEDTSIDVQEAAIAANKQSPDLIPAAVMAARAHIAKGKPKLAARVLTKAWSAKPHPDLAAAFAEIAPDETPAQRLKRFSALTKVNSTDPETQMLLAELHIAAEDFPAARRALGSLSEDAPTARVLTLMAAIERGSGSEDQVVRGWLTKALVAPRGPQWICDKCQSIHAEWEPVCQSCGSFDTLSWKAPAKAEVAMPAGTEMLPLIVGASASTEEPSEIDAEDATTVEVQN